MERWNLSLRLKTYSPIGPEAIRFNSVCGLHPAACSCRFLWPPAAALRLTTSERNPVAFSTENGELKEARGLNKWIIVECVTEMRRQIYIRGLHGNCIWVKSGLSDDFPVAAFYPLAIFPGTDLSILSYITFMGIAGNFPARAWSCARVGTNVLHSPALQRLSSTF